MTLIQMTKGESLNEVFQLYKNLNGRYMTYLSYQPKFPQPQRKFLNQSKFEVYAFLQKW